MALSTDAAIPASAQLFERSLAIRRKLLPADHPRLLESEQTLARVLMDDERCAEALPILEQVVEVKIRELGPDHVLTASAELRRADCIGELGDWDRAVGHRPSGAGARRNVRQAARTTCLRHAPRAGALRACRQATSRPPGST